MANYQDVFKRYEKKYMLTESQYEILRQNLEGYLVKDKFGLHTIGNIYFDTDNYELIRASIEKPVYKEKLRLRGYGTIKKDDSVFIELKKKYKGVVYKRRVQLPLKDAQAYLVDGKQPGISSQILREIHWFLQSYQPMPKVYIAYDRIAFAGRADSNLRLTFDHNIRFRESSLDPAKGHWGTPLLDQGRVLMEIKVPGSMPLWLSKILTEQRIFPTSFSKYGTCYQKFLLRKVYRQGGMTYA